MQQYYTDDIDQDPSRIMWNNSSSFINKDLKQNVFKKIIEDNKNNNNNNNELRDIIFNNSKFLFII